MREANLTQGCVILFFILYIYIQVHTQFFQKDTRNYIYKKTMDANETSRPHTKYFKKKTYTFHNLKLYPNPEYCIPPLLLLLLFFAF